MKEILGLVAEVEQKAVTIINLAKEEKEKLKQEELRARKQFEEQKKKEYEQKLTDYKAALDEKAKKSIQEMEQESVQNQMLLKNYYDRSKAALVNQVQQQIIGE